MASPGPPALTLPALVRATYSALGLHSFYTSGPTETRAWAVPVGARAPRAARAIHSDFEKGFIRAEAIGVAELLGEHASEVAARAAGAVRSEGKDYVVQGGDVLLFRFN